MRFKIRGSSPHSRPMPRTHRTGATNSIAPSRFGLFRGGAFTLLRGGVGNPRLHWARCGRGQKRPLTRPPPSATLSAEREKPFLYPPQPRTPRACRLAERRSALHSAEWNSAAHV